MTTHEATLALPPTSWSERWRLAHSINEKLAASARPFVLLALRLLFGSALMVTGWGKLAHLDRITGFFASLGIPWPALGAPFVAGLELVGGLLLVVGLGTRLVSIPLLATMAVALATAHVGELAGLLSDPGAFVAASPVPYLVALVVLFAFGPGSVSLDELVRRRRRSKPPGAAGR